MLDLVAQPIRPLRESDARCARRPFFEILLRPRCGRDPLTFVTDRYLRGEHLELDLEVITTLLATATAPAHYAVNVGLPSLAHPQFARSVLQAIAASRLPPGHLVMELSYRPPCTPAVWLDAAVNMRILSNQLGIAFALDDIDESDRLENLRRLPVGIFRYAKLDVHITSLLASGRLPSNVKAVLRFLGPNAQLIAEGVEDASMHSAIQCAAQHRVDYWQGFLNAGTPQPLLSPRRLHGLADVTSSPL